MKLQRKNKPFFSLKYFVLKEGHKYAHNYQKLIKFNFGKKTFTQTAIRTLNKSVEMANASNIKKEKGKLKKKNKKKLTWLLSIKMLQKKRGKKYYKKKSKEE